MFTDPAQYPPSVAQYDYEYMKRSICLFPQKPLLSGHVYKVDIVLSFGKRKQKTMGTIFKVR